MVGEGVTGAERTQAAGALRDKTLLTGVASLCGLAAAIIVIILLKDTREPDHLQAPWAWPVLLSLFTVFWLGAQLLRHSAMWGAYAAAYERPARARDPEQERIIRLGYSEFFIYLAVSLCGLGAIAYLSSGTGHFGAVEFAITGTQVRPLHLALFLGYFVAAFVPLLVVITRHAKLEAKERARGELPAKLLRDDVVSDFTFWTTAVLIAALVALAWAAAGDMFTMEEDFGVFITFLILLVFLVIILAPHATRWLNDWQERQQRHISIPKLEFGLVELHPGVWISRVDSVLVRIIAPLSGATQHGPFVPHFLVLLIILPLSAIGYVLAAPWGLVPIAAAMLIALALGRRWAWVEEDRETASRLGTTRGPDIAIGFDNDLKDEALLGYASFFILVPLALHQLQGWTHSFNYEAAYSSNNAFFDWLRFFGAELAKAVPFVDWWEIYNVNIETPFDASGSDNPLAKHLTFGARAMVDLVIMAALFQAIGLWQRSRMHKKYYKAGEVDAFDPFTEVAFFEKGMWKNPRTGEREPKKDFVTLVDLHVARRVERNWDRNPYSQRRLSELMESDNDDVKEGAKWMIRAYDVLVGTPVQQLVQLADRLRAAGDSKLRGKEKTHDFARAQKIELERILQELDRNIEGFSDADVSSLIAVLTEVRSTPEFAYAQSLAVTLLKKRPSRNASLALMLLAMQPRHEKSGMGRELWTKFKEKLGATKTPYIELYPTRAEIYQALAVHGFFYKWEAPSFSRLIADFLDWMGQQDGAKYGVKGDRSKEARLVARECESKVRAILRM